jgi:hypothetical protein
VKEHRVARVDITFKRLHVVAFALEDAQRVLPLGQHVGLEVG